MTVAAPEFDLEAPVDATAPLRRRRMLLALVSLLVFGAGGATGAAVAVRYVHERSKPVIEPIGGGNAPGPSDEDIRRMSDRWRTKLPDVSDEQFAQIVKLTGEGMGELHKIRMESHERSKRAFQDMERDMLAILTPEQQVVYKAELDKFRKGPPPHWDGKGRKGRPPREYGSKDRPRGPGSPPREDGPPKDGSSSSDEKRSAETGEKTTEKPTTEKPAAETAPGKSS